MSNKKLRLWLYFRDRMHCWWIFDFETNYIIRTISSFVIRQTILLTSILDFIFVLQLATLSLILTLKNNLVIIKELISITQILDNII
jgi:hypothetical protein